MQSSEKSRRGLGLYFELALTFLLHKMCIVFNDIKDMAEMGVYIVWRTMVQKVKLKFDKNNKMFRSLLHNSHCVECNKQTKQCVTCIGKC